MHRLVKQALDSGEAESVEAAELLFRSFRLSISIGAREALEPAHQAAFLTAIALASRVFLGGVCVHGALDAPLVTPILAADSLAGAARQLGGCVMEQRPPNMPHVTIGGRHSASAGPFDVRTSCAGWLGGIVPTEAEAPNDGNALPLAAMLSGALAVSEAFAFVRGEGAAAGRRDVGLSLWKPDRDWLRHDDVQGPTLQFLPSRLWLIGLGHLGQAYLWGLGLLPYPNPAGATLMLQDVDTVTPSTESTSILTDSSRLGQRKTRAMAGWAERRGFSTTICERPFDTSTVRRSDEPGIALCGLDNALGRRALDTAGFDLVVEAGLGRGYNDFRALRLHVLPGERRAAALWREDGAAATLLDRPAYKKLQAAGLDQCGVTLLAGKAVGAPFVGAVASTLALAEVLRLLHGGDLHQVIDLDLSSPEHRVVVRHRLDFSGINPGFVTL